MRRGQMKSSGKAGPFRADIILAVNLLSLSSLSSIRRRRAYRPHPEIDGPGYGRDPFIEQRLDFGYHDYQPPASFRGRWPASTSSCHDNTL